MAIVDICIFNVNKNEISCITHEKKAVYNNEDGNYKLGVFPEQSKATGTPSVYHHCRARSYPCQNVR